MTQFDLTLLANTMRRVYRAQIADRDRRAIAIVNLFLFWLKIELEADGFDTTALDALRKEMDADYANAAS